MKIALCLHGLFDSANDSSSKGADGFKHIKKYILENNDVDIYMHNWQPEKKEEIISLYNPKNFIFENQIDFNNLIQERNLHTLHGCPRSPKAVLSHFYSIQKVFKLCFSSKIKYDILIKSRFDLGRINRNTSVEYPVQCINFNKQLDMKYFYMADWPRFNCGPADMWFYSGCENMQKFTTIFDDLLKNFYVNSDYHNYAYKIENNKGDLSNSIIYYKYWLEKNGLWNLKQPLKCFYE